MTQPLPKVLPITPFHNVQEGAKGTVQLPGSKSITNRALIMAALGGKKVTLQNAIFSRDSKIMMTALKELGVKIKADESERTFQIQGLSGNIPNAQASIHVGNAGTAARFLTALVALKEGGKYYLDGDEAMRRRPIKGLLDVLVANGASVTYHGEEGHFPFTLRTNGLSGGNWTVDAKASSQILSALMMVAPYASGSVTFTGCETVAQKPFVKMTAEMMQGFNVLIDWDNRQVPKGCYDLPATYIVEPDLTAASYFLALEKIIGITVQQGFIKQGGIQGDAKFADVIKSLDTSDRSYNFHTFSDTFLTLAAIAPLLDGKTKIEGIAHTRFQECDRVLAAATELEKLGQKVSPSVSELQNDTSLGTLTVTPNIEAIIEAVEKRGQYIDGHVHPVVSIDTYEDHRLAMSFAILGSYDLFGDGRPWLAINDPACCGKTFPDFFTQLERLRKDVSEK